VELDAAVGLEGLRVVDVEGHERSRLAVAFGLEAAGGLGSRITTSRSA
jgi:hypothetical protein